jgi:site-specific recombinase XerD
MTAKGEFVPRQSTGLRDWAAGEAYLASLNNQIAQEIQDGDGITIADACKQFTDGHEEFASARVISQHKLVLDRFQTYANAQGVRLAAKITYDLCKNFQTYGFEAGIGDNTKSAYISKFKVFLGEAFTRTWIKENIADRLKNTTQQYDAGEPYSDEELSLILANAEKLNGGTTGYASNGKTFRLLLEFMLKTGLRVSDAVRFDPSACFKSKTGLWKYHYQPVKQRKDKKKKTAVTFLADNFKQAIDKAAWFSKKLPFAYDTINDTKSETDGKHEQAVYERMQSIGNRCELDDCRPHRLRDSFAVQKLQKGMAIEDVSKLLAHASIKVTLDHYAKWTIGREDRLEELFMHTL